MRREESYNFDIILYIGLVMVSIGLIFVFIGLGEQVCNAKYIRKNFSLQQILNIAGVQDPSVQNDRPMYNYLWSVPDSSPTDLLLCEVCERGKYSRAN